MPHVLVFDVNETLLDLGALDAPFAAVFGDANVRKVWFNQLIQSVLIGIATNHYTDFGTTAGTALDMIAARHKIALTPEQRQSILGGIRKLPPHPDARPALEQLRTAGFRLAALTNSTAQVANAQLEHAGLADMFEQILSADGVQRLKPAPEPYQMAARSLGVPINQILMVAAHSWDVAGALRAGCAAALVTRPGVVADPLAPPATLVGADLRTVAAAIIALN